MEDSSKVNPISRVRAKPELVTIGKRQIINTGRWNDSIMANYVMLNGKEKWLTIGELAKVAWGQNTIDTKTRARKYLSKLWAYLLVNEGRLLVVEYGERGRAQAVKMYDHNSEQERQALRMKLDRMAHNRELSAERYEHAIRILDVSSNEAA